MAIALAIIYANRVGIEHLDGWAFLVVGELRLTSIVIPAMPGTAYSLCSGRIV